MLKPVDRETRRFHQSWWLHPPSSQAPLNSCNQCNSNNKSNNNSNSNNNNNNNNNNNDNNNPSQEFLNLVGSIRQVALVGNVYQPGGKLIFFIFPSPTSGFPLARLQWDWRRRHRKQADRGTEARWSCSTPDKPGFSHLYCQYHHSQQDNYRSS